AVAADRKAIGHRAGPVGKGPSGNSKEKSRRGRGLHPALPPALAGGEGEGAHRQPGRRDAGDLARLHEPAGRARQLQAHLRPLEDLADGDLGTHALDIVMWMMEAKKPVELYARSVDKALGPICKGIDATAGTIVFEDGSLYHAAISWALPVVWPGAVYSLEVGINGTEGVLTIDDTHRDIVLATSRSQSEGYNPDNQRKVDFLGSYPPGDMALGELRGPMREETEQWLNRVSMGHNTQHATAAEAHNRLMLTKAFDKSAKLKKAIPLPIEEE